MQTGPLILMTSDLLQVLVFILAQTSSLGGPRNKLWWHFPVQRQNIEVQLISQHKSFGSGPCSLNWTENSKTPHILCDNLSNVSPAHNPTLHNRTKHMEFGIFIVCEKVLNKSIVVSHVPTQDQMADVLTKGPFDGQDKKQYRI